MQWFRLHNKLLNDPVVQNLSDKQFKIYINLLCHASIVDEDGCLGTIDEISFALRETKENVTSCFIALHDANLIVTSGTDGETFHIPQWKKKQYKSDTSTDRVRKHRQKTKRSKTVTVTPPDTDTDTEQKQIIKKEKSTRFVPPTLQEVDDYFREKGTIDHQHQAKRFFDHYESNGWMVGKNKMKNWKAAVSGWISRSLEKKALTVSKKPDQEEGAFIDKHLDKTWADNL